MAKKEDVLDRRTLDRYRKQISDDFEQTYREKMVKDLSDEIYKDVQKNFDVEYKNKLVETVTNDIYDEVKEKVNKEERKVSAHKSFKIFRLSVYILVLLAIIIYVIFRLYKTNNFDIMKYNYVAPETTTAAQETTEPTTQKIDYKALYGYLIDNIKITDANLFKGNISVSNLSMEQRLNLVYSTLSKDDVEVDGTINTLRSSTLKSAYSKLFGTDDYEAKNFNVLNLNYIYSTNKNEFIAIQTEENKDIYKLDLVDASDDDNNIYVKALAYRIVDDKAYSITLNKEIGSVEDLAKFEGKLDTITLVFNKDKKLIGFIN